MATTAKPGAGAKPDATEKTDTAPAKKSKKMLIIILALLLIGGGIAAYLLLKPTHAPAKDAAATEEAGPEISPIYVALGTFTANLIHEEGDRYLQVAISIKLSKPELEEKIKASNPEILHHVNMLLQSKRPSELATLEGKDKLSTEIKIQIERVLGFHKTPPINGPTPSESASAPAITEPLKIKSGIEEVLFTSFIIQ
jgi:flagellar FliL protein